MGKHKSARKAGPQGLADKGVATREDHSPHVHQRERIGFDLTIRTRSDLTERQRQFIDLIMDKETKLVFLDGPAGTAKTYLSIYCGLMLLQKRTLSDILYVRSIAESASKSLGSLPGDEKLKLQPFMMPLQDKLDELLDRGAIQRLSKEERVTCLPVNYLRGSSFNARFVLADEAQNLDIKELTTLVTRLGRFSKMIVAGDRGQSDINGRSGFAKVFQLFDGEDSRQRGIHCFSFTKDDIVRSGILKYIVERLESQPRPDLPGRA